MSDHNVMHTRPLWLGRVSIWLATISSVVLALMMVFVFVGAILRYAFNAPIPGGNEVLEMASVALIMLAIPYCTLADGHVRIDLLDGFLPRFGKAFTEVLSITIGTVVLAYLVKSYVSRSLDALEFEDVTNMLAIPLWPFYALVVFGMGLYAIILLVQLINLILKLRTPQ